MDQPIGGPQQVFSPLLSDGCLRLVSRTPPYVPKLPPKSLQSIFHRGSSPISHCESVAVQFVLMQPLLIRWRLGENVDIRLENPCVGGSIPSRATNNIVHATPTYVSGRCRFWGSQSLCPVYFRCQDDARPQGQGRPLIVRSPAVHAISQATQMLSGPKPD